MVWLLLWNNIIYKKKVKKFNLFDYDYWNDYENILKEFSELQNYIFPNFKNYDLIYSYVSKDQYFGNLSKHNKKLRDVDKLRVELIKLKYKNKKWRSNEHKLNNN